jgi:uncharacterized membrane protein
MASLAIVLHLLAAILWVGGMAFAHFCLRPAAAELDPAARLPLFCRTLDRFFQIVLGAVLVLSLTGYVLLFGHFGGFGGAPIYVHVMHVLGWVMFLLFAHLYFAPWRRFRRLVEAGDLSAAATQLGQIRTIVTVNLALGLVTSALGTGRYWLG